MYISKLEVEGFRNLNGVSVNFTNGINVIIGPNNSGKSNVFRALSLILDYGGNKRLGINDFSKNITLERLKQKPPSISVSVVFTENLGGSTEEDLVTVSDWLLKVDSPFKAKLTYRYFLPEYELISYKEALEDAEDIDEGWRIVERDFLRKYTYSIYGGNPTHQKRADGESLKRIDWQFLDAVRDVDKDLFSNRRSLLKEVINFFRDYDIKTDDRKSKEEINEALRNRSKEFEQEAKPLIEKLLDRIESGKKEILKYATDTGALFKESQPEFTGVITDNDIVELLELMISHLTGIKLPAVNNGLGYNNLIYISFLLAKMQINANSDYYGSNVKLFPVLAIEEPEAHLHPSMQDKFLQFLNKNLKERVKQVFISTHSTHITSSVSLDDLICLSNEVSVPNISYPGKVFSDTAEDNASKTYIERFLDATKSSEKAAVMEAFQLGELGLLVATTVIEVGVDVPNASLMVIEHAERFGLAQLHQLRGRVGRGAAQSVCVLLYQMPLSAIAKERLRILHASTDGFEIAQRDLELRGPGELLGVRQSGTALLRFADLNTDSGLVAQAREAATWMRREYPAAVEKHLTRWLRGRSEFLKA